MASRHCEKCGELWPGHHMTCPVCKTPCSVSDKHAMTEELYKYLLYTKCGRVASVSEKEEQRMQAEWESLEAEVERRGKDRWSIADLLEEGWLSVREPA